MSDLLIYPPLTTPVSGGWTPIPARYMELCRAVARLARDAGLPECSFNFKPPYEADDWKAPVAMTWERDRFGNDSEDITIASTVHVFQRISEQAQPQTPPP